MTVWEQWNPCHTLRRSLPCLTMPPETETVGVCPECGAEIGPGQILIEYEQEDRSRGLFAECYACEAVVSPQ